VRYCRKECQDRSSEQHKEKCQELKEVSRRQQECYSHVAKELFPCPGGLSFTKYNHRVTKRFHQLIREVSEQHSSEWELKENNVVFTFRDGPLMKDI
jgi:hypothetical protein